MLAAKSAKANATEAEELDQPIEIEASLNKAPEIWAIPSQGREDSEVEDLKKTPVIWATPSQGATIQKSKIFKICK